MQRFYEVLQNISKMFSKKLMEERVFPVGLHILPQQKCEFARWENVRNLLAQLEFLFQPALSYHVLSISILLSDKC